MNRPHICLLYLNGTIAHGPSGIKFEGPSPRGFRISHGISYDDFVSKIRDVLNLDVSQKILKLVYRFPLAVQGAQMNCVPYEIRNNEDIEMMFDTHIGHSVLIGMEVNVEVDMCLTVHMASPVQQSPDPQSIPNPYPHFDTQQSGFGLYTQLLMNAGPSTCLPFVPPMVDVGHLSPDHRPNSPAPHAGIDDSGIGDVAATLDHLAVASSPPSTSNLYFSGVGTEDEDLIPDDCSDDDGSDDDGAGLNEGIPSTDHILIPPNRSFAQPNWDVADAPHAQRPYDIIWPSNWDPTKELFHGMLFRSKADVQMGVRLYSLNRHHDCTVVESQPTYWSIKCKHHIGGCGWRLRASQRKRDGLWEIKRYSGPHSCVHPGMSRDHHQLTSTVIANCIVGMVSADPSISVAVIIEELRSRYQYEVSYKKAWYGKQKAIVKAFGDWDDSYRQLPKFMLALQHSNPGTVVVWDTVETSGDGHHWALFKRLFWAFKPSIDGFNYCRPVIQIDGTFLCGKYQGTLLTATSVDGSNRIYPIAFAIVEGENRSSWSWFLTCIRHYVTQRPEICLISDRHAGIIDAVQNVAGWQPPNAYHRFCLRHVVSNFNRRFKNPHLKTMVYNAGTQFQIRKFHQIMDAVRIIDRDAAGWFDSIAVECWTQCYDEGRRHGHMTTNMAECINGVLKGIRRLPVTALVHHTFLRLVSYFQRRLSDSLSLMHNGERYTTLLRDEMEKQTRRASSHRVIQFDRQQLVFQVVTSFNTMTQRGGNEQTVKLREHFCSCGRFVAMRFPCSHAIAACAQVSIDCYRYVDDCYSIEAAVGCYRTAFAPIPHPDYWQETDRLPLFPNPNLLRPHGRPRTRRISNEMDWRDPRSGQKCSFCRKEGHNRKRCPDRIAGAGPSR